jgi:hypothetical protein
LHEKKLNPGVQKLFEINKKWQQPLAFSRIAPH